MAQPLNPYLADFLREVKNKGRAKGSLFELKKGEEAKIRFITDLNMIHKMPIHGRWIENQSERQGRVYNIPCPLEYGKNECPFDSLDEVGGRYTKNHFSLIVYDYRDGEVKVFCYKSNRMTPMPQLIDHYNNFTVNTLLGRDFKIVRGKNGGFDTNYTVTPLDREDAPTEVTDAIAKELVGVDLQDQQQVFRYIREMLANALFPKLLDQGETRFPQLYLNDSQIIPSSIDGSDEDEEFLP